MKDIIVANQPRLGLRRILRITVDGIRYRLFRAAVTVAVIAVAVAFLLNILSESLIKRAVAHDTRDRLAHARLVHEWTSRLGTPAAPEAILREAAQAVPGNALHQTGGMDASELDAFNALARTATGYLDFFDGLDYARRRRLVHQAEGTGIFEKLAAPGGLDAFLANLKDTRSVKLPGTEKELQAFLAQWPLLRTRIEAIRAGEAVAVARIETAREGRPVIEALTEADGRFGQVIRDAGFALDAETGSVLAEQARRLIDAQAVERSFESRTARQVIARHHDVLPGDVTVAMLWRFLAEADHAREFRMTMLEAGIGQALPEPALLSALSADWSEMNRLEQAGQLTADMGDGWLGLGQRMAFLLMVSMLVCAIGISNAMLMTVTERFREIATLKCLGALDGFIMTMFVLESCIMGVVGGLAGGILGAALGSLRMLTAFGTAFLRSFPLLDLSICMLAAMLVGICLAAAAAIYPSFRAARLAPMEAMRVE